MVNMEATEQFNQIVLDFMSACLATPNGQPGCKSEARNSKSETNLKS